MIYENNSTSIRWGDLSEPDIELNVRQKIMVWLTLQKQWSKIVCESEDYAMISLAVVNL